MQAGKLHSRPHIPMLKRTTSEPGSSSNPVRSRAKPSAGALATNSDVGLPHWLARYEVLTLEWGRAEIIRWVFHREGEANRQLPGGLGVGLKAAGGLGRVPHDVRRTALRNLIRAGVPEKAAMRLTGHKTHPCSTVTI
jgi:hypothetical protein